MAVEVRRAFPGFETCFEAVRSIIRPLIENVTDAGLDTSKKFTIEADFSQRSGPDLSFVADHASLTINEVVKIFASVDYRFYMLGFLPGFTYMGQDPKFKKLRTQLITTLLDAKGRTKSKASLKLTLPDILPEDLTTVNSLQFLNRSGPKRRTADKREEVEVAS